MNDLGISHFFTELATWVYGTTSLTILVGLIVFLLTLWILPMTKWGRTNPVAKCVGLSVMAHVLLLCYAYGTSLITEIPIHHPPAPVPIKIAAKTVKDNPKTESPNLSSGESKPFWKKMDHSSTTATPISHQSNPGKQSVEAIPSSVRNDFSHTPKETQQPAALIAEGKIPQRGAAGTRTTQSTGFQPTTGQTSSAPRTGSQSIATAKVPRYFQSNHVDQQSTMAADKWMKNHLAAPGLKRPLSQSNDFNQDLISPKKWDLSQNNQRSSWDIHKGAMDSLPNSRAGKGTQNLQSDFGGSAGTDTKVSQPAGEVRAKSRPSVYRRIADGQMVPARYHGRFQRNLQSVIQKGGTADSERAVRKALAYLARIQKADGSFDPRSTEGGKEKNVYGHNRRGAGAQADTGITGLALLAWMANGNTHLEGPYKENVRRGLNYLIRRQHKNGSLAGSAQFFAQMYCHSMALLAISEAYCLTGDPELAAAVKKAVDYSQTSQNRHGGGWRYRPGEQGDMSQFGWQVMSLVGAKLAGTKIDRKQTV